MFQNPGLAFVAAIIAGIFSLVTLILSKEVKVSEARLTWNHEFRAELAKMLARMDLLTKLATQEIIERAPRKSLTNQELLEFREKHKEIYTEMNQAFFHSNLCLDPKFKHEKYGELLSSLTSLRDKFWSDCENIPAIEETYTNLLRLARDVLFFNWSLVHKGEPAFFYTKKILIWITAILSGFGFLLLVEYGIENILGY